jgi:antitoxin MazE
MITLMPPVPAKLVAIGNSRGVRIPKAMIEQIGLGEEVELEVVDGTIVIRRKRRPREGWAEAAKLLAERGEELPPEITDMTETEWMRDHWRWE